MKLRLAVLVFASLSMSACTTVNMTELPSPTLSAKAKVSDNVVVKASERLEQQFVSKGWIDKAEFKIKQAAMTLLRGRNADNTPTVSQAYAEKITPTLLKADITEATYIANQTLRAADVYLEYAENDADLSKDLNSLEKALLNCRKAENTFANAAANREIAVDGELALMSRSLEQLQAVTDTYGDRVRAGASIPVFGDSAVN